MPFSLVITGIFTGTIAALLAFILDRSVVMAMLTYALSGGLALLGAGVVTSIRRNFWPRKKLGRWSFSAHPNRWQHRLDRMAHQSKTATHVGLFTPVERDARAKM